MREWLADDVTNSFINKRVPVVLEGVSAPWPARTSFTPDALKARFADREIVTRSLEREGTGRGGFYGGAQVMTFGAFLDEIATGTRDLRMVAENLLTVFPELRTDFAPPTVGTGYSSRLVWVFLGSGQSRTPLHYDFDWRHIMHTLFFGTKRFVMFAHDQTPHLHKIPFAARSHLDALAPDFDRFPRAKQLRGYVAELGPGDTLYLPPGMWHDVRHATMSCAISQRFNNGDAYMLKMAATLLTARIGDAYERAQRRTARTALGA